MNQQALGELRTEFPGASWAIWSESYPQAGCLEEDPERLTEFIERNVSRLTPTTVFLSTNPAGNRPIGYRNFHRPDVDTIGTCLKAAVQDGGQSKLLGGYMTDLLPTPRACGDQELRTETTDIDLFLDQLEALRYPEFHVICLRGQAFDLLTTEFNTEVSELPHELQTTTISTRSLTVHLYGVPVPETKPSTNASSTFTNRLAYLNDEIV